MAKIIGNTTATPSPIGNLSNLKTKNKNSIVDAINEAAESGGSSSGVYISYDDMSEEPSENYNLWIDMNEDYGQNSVNLYITDDGNGNVILNTNGNGNGFAFTDDGNGNIRMEAI